MNIENVIEILLPINEEQQVRFLADEEIIDFLDICKMKGKRKKKFLKACMNLPVQGVNEKDGILNVYVDTRAYLKACEKYGYSA